MIMFGFYFDILGENQGIATWNKHNKKYFLYKVLNEENIAMQN